MKNSAFRQILDQWFETHSIRPRILGEFQDTALLTMFGQAGAGIFAAPIAIEREVRAVIASLSSAILTPKLQNITLFPPSARSSILPPPSLQRWRDTNYSAP
jgi:hypothetical protein